MTSPCYHEKPRFIDLVRSKVCLDLVCRPLLSKYPVFIECITDSSPVVPAPYGEGDQRGEIRTDENITQFIETVKASLRKVISCAVPIISHTYITLLYIYAYSRKSGSCEMKGCPTSRQSFWAFYDTYNASAYKFNSFNTYFCNRWTSKTLN